MLDQRWYDKIASGIAAAEEALANAAADEQAAAVEQDAAEKLQQDIDLTQAVAADDSVTTEEKIAILENEGVEPEIIDALIEAETTDAVAAYYGIDPYWLADKQASMRYDKTAAVDPGQMAVDIDNATGGRMMPAGIGGAAGMGAGALGAKLLGKKFPALKGKAGLAALAGAGLGAGIGAFYPEIVRGTGDAAVYLDNNYISKVPGALEQAGDYINARPMIGQTARNAAIGMGAGAAAGAAGAKLLGKSMRRFGGIGALLGAGIGAAVPNVAAYYQNQRQAEAAERAKQLAAVESAKRQRRAAMGAGLGGLAGAGLGYLAGDGMGAAIGGLAGAGLGGAGGYFAKNIDDWTNRNVNFPVNA